MVSYMREDPEDSKELLQKLKRTLLKENECYVLIVCKQGEEEKKLQVEMEYEGDATLVSYLIESAQQFV